MSEYLITLRHVRTQRRDRRGRRISKRVFVPEPGKTMFLKAPGGKLPVPEHAITKKEWVKQVTAQAARGQRRNPLTGLPVGDVLVYVHGYNNELDKVIARHRLLGKDLKKWGYQGAVLSFDWPSDDKVLNYLEDRSDARRTAIKLVDDCITLLSRQQVDGCEINVHLLAHSTGAFVVREAFDDADDRQSIAAANWSVSQILFVGADVSQKSLSTVDSKSDSLYRHCARLTNYSNPYDSVLKLSNVKRVGVSPRVGRVGLPDGKPQKAVNVNCGNYFKRYHPGDSGHSWYFGDVGVARDLLFTIQGDIDRSSIPTRQRDPELGLCLRNNTRTLR